MLYRFTLAAVVAATTLTGCAAFNPASTQAPVREAAHATDAPVAAAQPAESAQPVEAAQPVPSAQPAESTPSADTAQPTPVEQPVQTQPITAPGAVTEPVTPAAASAETPASTAEAPATSPSADVPAATASAPAPVENTTPAAAAPVKDEKISASESTQAVAPFSSGPTQIDVSHIVTRADDGSSITLTIDGTEAGILKRGEKRAVFVEPGKHQVGGYVQTLFGLGRVTIPPVEITTVPGKVKKVDYSVTRTKPAFTEATDSQNSAG